MLSSCKTCIDAAALGYAAATGFIFGIRMWSCPSRIAFRLSTSLDVKDVKKLKDTLGPSEHSGDFASPNPSMTASICFAASSHQDLATSGESTSHTPRLGERPFT